MDPLTPAPPPPPGSRPAVLAWTVDADGRPVAGALWPPAQPVAEPLPAPRRAGRGVAGTALAALAAAGKYGIALVKLAKLGPTLVSMVLSLGVLAWEFGPAFGAGLLLLIAVHESGHLLFARYEGVKVGAPVFLGPFGAVIGMKQPPRDARQEAVIAIGGPVVGTAGALACGLAASVVPPGHLQRFLLALAYVGFLINLFNLVPLTPLDGGRVVSALSRWFNVLGLLVVLALLVGSHSAGVGANPFLVVILVIGAIGTLQRFRQARLRPEYLAVAPGTRLLIGAAYLGMLAITAVGMSAAHAALAG